jgi:hypothetical protein
MPKLQLRRWMTIGMLLTVGMLSSNIGFETPAIRLHQCYNPLHGLHLDLFPPDEYPVRTMNQTRFNKRHSLITNELAAAISHHNSLESALETQAANIAQEEANTALANIAAQTNILAINAAN